MLTPALPKTQLLAMGGAVGAGTWEGGGGANLGCTLMTSPPSTFISFWRFPQSRLGLERHFSSPSRFTGQEEWGSQH